MPSSLWTTYVPENGTSQQIQIGPLVIRLRWMYDEIWVAHGPVAWPPVASGQDATEAPPAWERWALAEGSAAISLSPVMPPLPLLLRPDNPYRVLPGATTRIYTRIPLWVRVKNGNNTLVDIPTVRQSTSWFGTPVEGELCLSHYSSVRRFLTDDFYLPHLAGSVLEIWNASSHNLNFEKICFRTDILSVFSSRGGHLWTDTTRVVYRGSAMEGEVHATGKAPDEATDPVVVLGPRVRRNDNVVARTFDMLRDIRLF